MNEAPDPLESELSALRPQEVSPELRRRIAERLAACHAFAADEEKGDEDGVARPRKHATPPSPVPSAGGGAVGRRRWLVLAGGLAAASLVTALLWWWNGRRPEPELTVAPPQPAPRAGALTTSGSPDNLAALLKARRVPDEAPVSAFSWPLQETSPLKGSTSIPPDLLD
jgi:hypothetical protein